MQVEELVHTGINYVANPREDTLAQVGSLLLSMQDLLRDTLVRNRRSVPYHSPVRVQEQHAQEGDTEVAAGDQAQAQAEEATQFADVYPTQQAAFDAAQAGPSTGTRKKKARKISNLERSLYWGLHD